MAWRVLVRFSLEGDKNSKVRNEVVQELETLGMAQMGAKKKTATWEVDAATPADVAKTMSDALAIIAKKKAAGRLDHVWIYIDKAR